MDEIEEDASLLLDHVGIEAFRAQQRNAVLEAFALRLELCQLEGELAELGRTPINRNTVTRP
jgi:hypothetical protein